MLGYISPYTNSPYSGDRSPPTSDSFSFYIPLIGLKCWLYISYTMHMMMSRNIFDNYYLLKCKSIRQTSDFHKSVSFVHFMISDDCPLILCPSGPDLVHRGCLYGLPVPVYGSVGQNASHFCFFNPLTIKYCYVMNDSSPSPY